MVNRKVSILLCFFKKLLSFQKFPFLLFAFKLFFSTILTINPQFREKAMFRIFIVEDDRASSHNDRTVNVEGLILDAERLILALGSNKITLSLTETKF
jgi:hypothetical protein